MDLTTEEEEVLPSQLSDILDFVEKLSEVDTDNVPPTSQVTGLEDIMRADEATYTFEKSDMTKCMPDTDEQGHLRVHAVFTDDSPSH